MNQHYDGALNTMHRQSETNYFPSRSSGARHASNLPANTAEDEIKDGQAAVRGTIPVENNFEQAGERFRSFDSERQERFVSRVAETLNEAGVSKQLKTIWLGYWGQCDASLGARVAQKVKRSSM